MVRASWYFLFADFDVEGRGKLRQDGEGGATKLSWIELGAAYTALHVFWCVGSCRLQIVFLTNCDLEVKLLCTNVLVRRDQKIPNG